MDYLFNFFGRCLFIGVFVSAGIKHVLEFDNMVELLGGHKYLEHVPQLTENILYLQILCGLAFFSQIFGGFLILLGKRIGYMMLAGFLVGVSCLFHNFWEYEDEKQKEVHMIHFMKNMSLLGACLILFTLDVAEKPQLIKKPNNNKNTRKIKKKKK
eukprot:TRINITY_DN1615_c3_g3_i1.p1 TRINITY_DN1615_c3_g3~~TRINITY_DN1615_c3_g3_i1.p1  ORF type:complete len:156 (-),score=17.64 TRINITY_DN1615_c3_g3_i1:126-593(-)